MATRSHASRGTPSTALSSGSLLEFLRPWSDDHVASISSSFPSSDAGWGPRRFRRTFAQATPHLL